MGRSAEGRSQLVSRTVCWDRGADPHTWTSALQQGVPPYTESRLTAGRYDSASSADATTATPTQSMANDRGEAVVPLCSGSGTRAADRVWDIVWPPTLRGTYGSLQGR